MGCSVGGSAVHSSPAKPARKPVWLSARPLGPHPTTQVAADRGLGITPSLDWPWCHIPGQSSALLKTQDALPNLPLLISSVLDARLGARGSAAYPDGTSSLVRASHKASAQVLKAQVLGRA